MINTVIDDYRRNKKRKEQELIHENVSELDHTEVNEYLQHMESEAFAELLLSVPPMSRDVFNLFAMDGYSHQEIATMLDISEGTSKWHVSNARSILQKAIARLAVRNAQTASR
jgi:RNA polymerase sigma-70 factor (ECF subfamily)